MTPGALDHIIDLMITVIMEVLPVLTKTGFPSGASAAAIGVAVMTQEAEHIGLAGMTHVVVRPLQNLRGLGLAILVDHRDIPYSLHNC